jgi:prostaglandin-endoperoxide synthase 2
VISDASRQPAGRIGLANTPAFLRAAELRGLGWARDFRVEGFNAYRQRFGLRPYESIEALARDADTAKLLSSLYNSNVDAVELTVGLFAEHRDQSELMGETVTRMVAYDAFTHILTNPVLASEIYNPASYSPLGWAIASEGAGLVEIVRRNADPSKSVIASLSLVR